MQSLDFVSLFSSVIYLQHKDNNAASYSFNFVVIFLILEYIAPFDALFSRRARFSAGSLGPGLVISRGTFTDSTLKNTNISDFDGIAVSMITENGIDLKRRTRHTSLLSVGNEGLSSHGLCRAPDTSFSPVLHCHVFCMAFLLLRTSEQISHAEPGLILNPAFQAFRRDHCLPSALLCISFECSHPGAGSQTVHLQVFFASCFFVPVVLLFSAFIADFIHLLHMEKKPFLTLFREF